MKILYKYHLHLKRNYVILLSLGILWLAILIGGLFIDYDNLFLYLKAQDSLTIEYDGEKFNPEKVVVFKGAEVTFKNLSEREFWPASNIHPINGLYPEFNSNFSIVPDDSWSFVFERVGEWDYIEYV